MGLTMKALAVIYSGEERLLSAMKTMADLVTSKGTDGRWLEMGTAVTQLAAAGPGETVEKIRLPLAFFRR